MNLLYEDLLRDTAPDGHAAVPQRNDQRPGRLVLADAHPCSGQDPQLAQPAAHLTAAGNISDNSDLTGSQ